MNPLKNLLYSPWIRGQCWDMAIALSERYCLPMAGLYDVNGDCHHAFVISEDGSQGLDFRGWQTIEQLKSGCKGQNVLPLSREQIEAPGGIVGRALDPAELLQALKAAREQGIHIPTKVRNSRPKP